MENNKDFSQFTIDQYTTIAKYKTAFYTFSLPASIGYILTNNTDKHILNQLQSIGLEIGYLYQVQVSYILFT